MIGVIELYAVKEGKLTVEQKCDWEVWYELFSINQKAEYCCYKMCRVLFVIRGYFNFLRVDGVLNI